MNPFFTLCKLAALSRQDVITLFHVSPSTYHNWKKHGAPSHVISALTILTGDLTPAGMPGWRAYKGQIHSPAGESFTPREIESIPIRAAELAAYKTANDRYRRQLPDPFRLTKLEPANDEKKPERPPAFSTGFIWMQPAND